jgi:uracil phosphoribosyltransferase/phosphoserine phosphatase/adenylate kinase
MSSTKTPIVVGLYGIPGSGKTYVKEKLQGELHERFQFYDGSQMLQAVSGTALAEFKLLDKPAQTAIREKAIRKIASECKAADKIGVVTGHLMFWPHDRAEDEVAEIYTAADLEVYRYIFYLAVPATRVRQQRLQDPERRRSDASVEHLEKHQRKECASLTELCFKNKIPLMVVDDTVDPDAYTLVSTIRDLLNRFVLQQSDECRNHQVALDILDDYISQHPNRSKLDTIVVVDADKTLGPFDAGNLWWQKRMGGPAVVGSRDDPVSITLHPDNMGYSYQGFQQAVLMYEHETPDRDAFETTCRAVAEGISLYPPMRRMLDHVRGSEFGEVIVVTCGLRRVWEMVLERFGVTGVRVIGSGRVDDGYVVTGETKTAIVRHLRRRHQMRVIAIGDSQLDMGMMKEAHGAIVIMGEEELRSRGMARQLRSMSIEALQKFRQVCIPATVPALEAKGLLRIPEPNPLDMYEWEIRTIDATDKSAAKLLATPMRDASISGRALQEAHRKVGWYLVTEYLSEDMGLEPYETTHVQGKKIDGHRIVNEGNSIIIPLMRGGEPMAFGVHDAMPTAAFLHSKEPHDIKAEHLKGRKTIILVDSVINEGRSVAKHVNHISGFPEAASIRIVVITGVAQQESLKPGGPLQRALKVGKGELTVIALRKSENKYTGTGGTDTGHRLFKTEFLD